MSNATPRGWWGNVGAVLPHGLAFGVMFVAWVSMAFVYVVVEPWIDLLDDFALEPPLLTDMMARSGGFLGENAIVCVAIWVTILIVDLVVLKMLSSRKLLWGVWYGVMMVTPIIVGLTAVYALRILPRHHLASILELDRDILPSVNDQPALTTTLEDKSLTFDERFQAGLSLRTLGQIAKTKIILPLSAPVTDSFLRVAGASDEDIKLRTYCAAWTHDLFGEELKKQDAEKIAATYADALDQSDDAKTREAAASRASKLGPYVDSMVPGLINALADADSDVQASSRKSLLKIARVNESIRAKLRKSSTNEDRPEEVRLSSQAILKELGE